MATRLATGKVTRLYANHQGAFIRLKYEGTKPKDNYFFLPIDQVNYNSMFSLATVATVNKYNLNIGVKEEAIDSETIAHVYYLFF